jgi:hypothetical protein
MGEVAMTAPWARQLQSRKYTTIQHSTSGIKHPSILCCH